MYGRTYVCTYVRMYVRTYVICGCKELPIEISIKTTAHRPGLCELTNVRILRRSVESDVKALNIHRQVDVKLNELAKQILMLLPLLLLLLLLLCVLYT